MSDQELEGLLMIAARASTEPGATFLSIHSEDIMTIVNELIQLRKRNRGEI